jgi:hypothetical protein
MALLPRPVMEPDGEQLSLAARRLISFDSPSLISVTARCEQRDWLRPHPLRDIDGLNLSRTIDEWT